MALTRQQKYFTYFVGFALGLLVIMLIPRPGPPEDAPPTWQEQKAPAGYYPRTETDAQGEPVTLERQPRRLAVFTPAAAALVQGLDLGHRIIATSTPELATATGGRAYTMPLEATEVEASAVDLAIIGPETPNDVRAALATAGVPIFVVDQGEAEAWAHSIRHLGLLTARSREALGLLRTLDEVAPSEPQP